MKLEIITTIVGKGLYANGKIVAIVTENTTPTFEEIVKRVNLYDELLEGCISALDWLNNNEPLSSVENILQTTIKKSKEYNIK